MQFPASFRSNTNQDLVVAAFPFAALWYNLRGKVEEETEPNGNVAMWRPAQKPTQPKSKPNPHHLAKSTMESALAEPPVIFLFLCFSIAAIAAIFSWPTDVCICICVRGCSYICICTCVCVECRATLYGQNPSSSPRPATFPVSATDIPMRIRDCEMFSFQERHIYRRLASANRLYLYLSMHCICICLRTLTEIYLICAGQY